MKYLGELHYFLGFEVWIEGGKTLVTESKYTRDFIQRFNMNECKEMSIHLEYNLKLYSDDEAKQVDGTLYHQFVRSLIYLTTTSPHIAYPISVHILLMAKPHEIHQMVAKRVLQYLKGIINFFIKYTNEFNVELVGHSDSQQARNPDRKK